MTTLADLEALVIAQTRRPEVPEITQAAIRAATLRAHHVDFFTRDLTQANLIYTPVSSAQFYDFPAISATLLRLRTIQQLESVDTTTLATTEILGYRELTDLYDKDNVRRPSIYTMIGDTLRVYPLSVTGQFVAYYYQNPATASLTYSSWIADTYPDELAMWAAAIVFVRTGFAEMAKQITDQHIIPFKQTLVESHLVSHVN